MKKSPLLVLVVVMISALVAVSCQNPVVSADNSATSVESRDLSASKTATVEVTVRLGKITNQAAATRCKAAQSAVGNQYKSYDDGLYAGKLVCTKVSLKRNGGGTNIGGKLAADWSLVYTYSGTVRLK